MFVARLLRFCILKWTVDMWHWFKDDKNLWASHTQASYCILVPEAVFFSPTLWDFWFAVNHKTVLQSSAFSELQESTDQFIFIIKLHMSWDTLNLKHSDSEASSELQWTCFFLGGGIGVGVVCHKWGLLTISILLGTTTVVLRVLLLWLIVSHMLAHFVFGLILAETGSCSATYGKIWD